MRALTQPSPGLDPSKRRLEAALLSALQDFEGQTGRCVAEVRVVNAATYEGGRCPSAIRVVLEEERR